MKKTWYRVTLDIAYEGEILDREGAVVKDETRAKEVLMRVVKHDIDVAFRGPAAGPVDWDLLDVTSKPFLP